MSEALERLKNIGAQKIYEDTHIPVEQVQAILYENFDGMNKVHFMGFVSIIEREYGEDLSSVRAHALEYFDLNSTSKDVIRDETLFTPMESKKKLSAFYLIAVIVLFVSAAIYMMNGADTHRLEKMIQTNMPTKQETKIVVDNNESDTNSSDVNESKLADINITEAKEVVEKKVVPPKAIIHALKIVARKKVWLGYIDVATGKKYQKTFVGDLELDPTKEWLLFFGHGYVDIVVDGKKESFSSKNRLRIHYQDGEIQKISLDEFKKLNRGKAW